MVLEILTQEQLSKGVFYSRWHSVGRRIEAEWLSYYDLKVGEIVGPILNNGNDQFIVTTYLTDLVELGDNYDDNTSFKIWDRDAGTMYLEDKVSGIRYNGYFESFEDLGEDGLKPIGSYCIFTPTIEEAIAETWVRMLELYPTNLEYAKVHHSEKRLDNIKEYIETWEDFIREYYPEYIIGVEI
jgi:hypothetical protein